jgi:hypothetical protein
MSPTMLSAMSCTNAIITHLISSSQGSYLDLSILGDTGDIIRIIAMRYMWSLMLSVVNHVGRKEDLDLGLCDLSILFEGSF